MSKQDIKQEIVDYINANSGEEDWAWGYPLDYIAEQVAMSGCDTLDECLATPLDMDDFNELLQECDGKAEDHRGDLVDFAAARNLMDEAICEGIVDAEDVSDYLARYAEKHEEKHGERFAPYYGMAW